MENITEKDLYYLRLLSKHYPTIQAASTEIINLNAILNLPNLDEDECADLQDPQQLRPTTSGELLRTGGIHV